MRKVDRKKFLPATTLELVVVDSEYFAMMHKFVEGYRAIQKELPTEGGLIVPGAAQHQADIAAIAQLALFGLIKSAIEVADSGKKFYAAVSDLAYTDSALPIGYGQTCSQPSLVALMEYLLDLERGMRVLEVGSGYGYSAAITSELIGPSGYLITMEIIPELAELAKSNLESHFGKGRFFGKGLEKRLKVIGDADGSIGLETDAPFDRIYLTAGVKSSFDPSILAKQLNPNGGILLFPEERGDLIKQIYEKGKLVNTNKYGDGNIGFVPLQGKNV